MKKKLISVKKDDRVAIGYDKLFPIFDDSFVEVLSMSLDAPLSAINLIMCELVLTRPTEYRLS